jgi:hypothetical protein
MGRLVSRRHRDGQAGQALVEFALIFPIFFLLLMGVIDLGRFVYSDATLSQAAREGARVAAVEAGWLGIPLSTPGCVNAPSDIGAGNPGAHVCRQLVSDMKSDIVAAINSMVVGVGPISATDVYISCNSGTAGDLPPTGAWTEAVGGNGCVDALGNEISSPGDQVSVRIVSTFRPITPIVSSIAITVSRSSSATMVIN